VKLYVDENFPEDLKENLRPIKNSHYQGYMFEADGWKWYDSYPEIIAFNAFVSNFLELAEQEEIVWAYEFVRIGEENDDIEENRSDYSDYQVSVERSIATDF